MSFHTLQIPWAAFLDPRAARSAGAFLHELWPPVADAHWWWQLLPAVGETLAMSAMGTLLAAAAGLLLALPSTAVCGSRLHALRIPCDLLLNLLRSIPELVWAGLLLLAVGLGPMAGTLALALHTCGVLGRLFVQSLAALPPDPAQALRVRGVGLSGVFLFALAPQILPQAIAYVLYRWENNIRAAAVLGVVGAGGLGQALTYHLGLFQMRETAGVLLAMGLLVVLVDTGSHWLRGRLG